MNVLHVDSMNANTLLLSNVVLLTLSFLLGKGRCFLCFVVAPTRVLQYTKYNDLHDDEDD